MDSHATPTDAQTWTVHNRDLHTRHQTPPVVPSPSICTQGHGLGCDTHLEGGLFARKEA